MRLATRLYFPDLIMPDVVNQLMNLMIGWIVVKEERIGTKSESDYTLSVLRFFVHFLNMNLQLFTLMRKLICDFFREIAAFNSRLLSFNDFSSDFSHFS